VIARYCLRPVYGSEEGTAMIETNYTINCLMHVLVY